MTSALAVVALAAYSAIAIAAPLSSQPTLPLSLSTAALEDFPIDSNLDQLFVSDPAIVVLGLRPQRFDPFSAPPVRAPMTAALLGLGTALAFLAILFGWQRSLRLRSGRRRRAKLVIRGMAPV